MLTTFSLERDCRSITCGLPSATRLLENDDSDDDDDGGGGQEAGVEERKDAGIAEGVGVMVGITLVLLVLEVVVVVVLMLVMQVVTMIEGVVVAFMFSNPFTMKDLGLGGITGLTGGRVDPRTSGRLDLLVVGGWDAGRTGGGWDGGGREAT